MHVIVGVLMDTTPKLLLGNTLAVSLLTCKVIICLVSLMGDAVVSFAYSEQYPPISVLRTLLNHVYSAITSPLSVLIIDKALSTGDLHFLKEIIKVPDCAVLLRNDLDYSFEQHVEAAVADSVL